MSAYKCRWTVLSVRGRRKIMVVGVLLILCNTFVTCRTSNKRNSSSDLISFVDMDGWRFRMTTRVGLSSLS